MAQTLLLKLNDAMVTYGRAPLLQHVDLKFHIGDKVALVGRNGSGKSTLARVIAGRLEPDQGTCEAQKGMTVGYLEQDPSMSGFETVGEYAARDLNRGQKHLIDKAMKGLGFAPNVRVSEASGGELRKAAIARVLANDPDFLILDEPTNHLDIQSILWIERRLSEMEAGLVLISHDRALLKSTTNRTVWIDRGTVRKSPNGFAGFENWRDKIFAEEESRRHNLDKKIKSETVWSHQGISARRRRNQGRLRELQERRLERKAMIEEAGKAAFELPQTIRKSRMLIDAVKLTKEFGQGPVVRDFSLRVVKG